MEKMKVNEKLMFIGQDFTTRQQVIGEACDVAYDLGYITEEFKTEILQREEIFPTGLNTPIPIAIPHIGVHCKHSFLAVVTTKTPISYLYMDSTEGILPVEISFVFGIVNPTDQLEVLRKMTAFFRDGDQLQGLRDAKTPQEGISILEQYLGDLVEIL